MTDTEFAAEWQRCPSLAEFCRITGLSSSGACNRAKRLRDHGEQLKYFSSDPVRKRTRRAKKYNWRKEKPWASRLTAARSRCHNVNDPSYARYGGRGIKCLLTLEESRLLWLRDGADKMRKASIDRIDPDGDYSFENCRYIEHEANSRARRNPKRMTEAQVLEVLESKESTYVLGRRLGFSDTAIFNIRRGNTWRHITQDPAALEALRRQHRTKGGEAWVSQ